MLICSSYGQKEKAYALLHMPFILHMKLSAGYYLGICLYISPNLPQVPLLPSQ